MDILCKLYQSVDLIAVSPSQILIVWRHVVLHQLTFCLTFENGCPEVEEVACSASEWPAVWCIDCKDKKKKKKLHSPCNRSFILIARLPSFFPLVWQTMRKSLSFFFCCITIQIYCIGNLKNKLIACVSPLWLVLNIVHRKSNTQYIKYPTNHTRPQMLLSDTF